MKKTALNIALVLVIIASLVVSVFVPWWLVWFVCLPVAWAAAVALIQRNDCWPSWLK